MFVAGVRGGGVGGATGAGVYPSFVSTPADPADPPPCVIQYAVREAGYTATDQALRLVQQNTQCKWLSVTNGDNIYGSDVFKHVLEVQPLKDTGRLPDVMLSPLDSRNYADQGTLRTHATSSLTAIDFSQWWCYRAVLVCYWCCVRVVYQPVPA